MLAADGLDQARGELERLAAGGAKSLLDLVNESLSPCQCRWSDTHAHAAHRKGG